MTDLTDQQASLPESTNGPALVNKRIHYHFPSLVIKHLTEEFLSAAITRQLTAQFF